MNLSRTPSPPSNPSAPPPNHSSPSPNTSSTAPTSRQVSADLKATGDVISAMASGNTAIFEPESAVATDRKRRDLIELCVGYALILIVIWTPRPWQKLSYFVAATFLVTVLYIARPGWKAMGLQPSKPARSLWLIGVALVVAAI